MTFPSDLGSRADETCRFGLLLILVLVGCRPSDRPFQAYFPQTLGNRWVYATTEGDTLIVEVVGNKAQDGNKVITVMESYFSWDRVMSSQSVMKRPLEFRIERDGTISRKVLEFGWSKLDLDWINQQANSLGGGWFPWYRFSAGDDDTWTSFGNLWEPDKFITSTRNRITMASRSDSVSTAYGNFKKCCHFHIEEMENNRVSREIDEWYAPEVGMVKRNVLGEPTGRRIEHSYHLVSFQNRTT